MPFIFSLVFPAFPFSSSSHHDISPVTPLPFMEGRIEKRNKNRKTLLALLSSAVLLCICKMDDG
jgi:hypothetical protein